MIAYFDSSAFVKLAVAEVGSAEARDLWTAADRRVSSRLLYPEARAALARAARMGRVAASEQRAVRSRVESLWEDVHRIELTPALGYRAGSLAELHRLRAYDAVHLATLEQVTDPETVLVAADEELTRAARALGVTVAPLPS